MKVQLTISIAFSLFAELCRLLETYGAFPSDESRAALEDYVNFILKKKRRQLVRSERAANDILEVMQFLNT